MIVSKVIYTYVIQLYWKANAFVSLICGFSDLVHQRNKLTIILFIIKDAYILWLGLPLLMASIKDMYVRICIHCTYKIPCVKSQE